MIWFDKTLTLEKLRSQRRDPCMIETLGIDVTGVGADFLEGTMPVDQRTRQPYGLLHGGASVALAETLASMAANLVVDPAGNVCVGLEINANHISAAREGVVHGRATAIHLGRTTQVWETRITQGEKLVCLSRMTLSVLKKKA